VIVIDASALLEILLQTDRAEALMRRALTAGERMHAPHLIDIEVSHVLRRLVQHRELTKARAEHAFEDLALLLIERHGHQALLPRIWQLRETLTAYDGAYVALGEALGAPILTCDAKLARAGGHYAQMELIET
jgi:predicted nucleic acid-binding protein